MNQSEIAKKLGLSQSAVSLVLNNPATSRVSAARKQLIISLLKQNSLLSPSGCRKSWNLGYVTDLHQDLRHPFYRHSLLGVEETAGGNHYNLIMECFRGRELNLLRKGKVDGLVVRSGPAFEYLQTLPEKIPLVLLNCAMPVLCCDIVMPDNRGAIFKAVSYLAARGVKRVAFLGASPDYSRYSCNYSERWQTFPEACAYYGLTGQAELLKPAPASTDAADAIAAKVSGWLNSPRPPQAVITVNYLYARLIKAACPGLLTIAGDNNQDGDSAAEDLLVLAQDVHFMGRLAVELLVRRLSDRERPFVRISSAVNLFQRAVKISFTPPDCNQPATAKETV